MIINEIRDLDLDPDDGRTLQWDDDPEEAAAQRLEAVTSEFEDAIKSIDSDDLTGIIMSVHGQDVEIMEEIMEEIENLKSEQRSQESHQ